MNVNYKEGKVYYSLKNLKYFDIYKSNHKYESYSGFYNAKNKFKMDKIMIRSLD